MSIVCPRCSGFHDSPSACPRCGAPSPYVEFSPAVGSSRGPRWQQTPWGRIFIGLVLSQGLFYGLRHLLTGVLIAFAGGTAQEVWGSFHGMLLLQAAQFVGLFLGGVLAGGGQRHGFILGAVVGVWNGVLAVLLRQNPANGLTMVGLYGQPLIHAAVGALGGWVGSFIWRPITITALPGLLGPGRKPARRPKVSPFAGKVAWFRVLAGAVLAVAGTVSAAMLFDKLLDMGGGRLGTTDELQDRLITWEIKALALLVGGALAGATTPNGLKQGLVVGLLSSLALILLEARLTPRWLEVAALTMVSSFSLALVGGWFGGQLFPPVVKINRPRGVGAMS